MINSEVSRILYEMAEMLDIQGVEWKPRAYKKAAQVIESLSKDLTDIYKEGGIKALIALPGIGEGIAKKIVQFIETGRIKDFEKLKKEIPVDIKGLMLVEGLGPKTIKRLYMELNVKNLGDLEKAAKSGKISRLEGFKKKTEENILEAIKFARQSGKRKTLGYALPIAEEILNYLKKFKSINNAELAGSIRRKKETIGDIDILVTSSKPNETMDYFTDMKGITRVISKGQTKSTVIYKGMEVDVRVLKPDQFGSALNYFTGNKNHNIALRKIAIKRGFKLSEYGLFRGKEKICGKTEKEIYEKLGMQYIEPELRRNAGEIEAALQKKLPKLVNLSDIRGDLQSHSNWSDGADTILEMAEAAKKLGHEYLAVTDHVGMIKVAGAMDAKKISRYSKTIDKTNEMLEKFTLLKGAEVDIKPDGSLAATKKTLEKLDLIIAAVHSGFKKDNTSRIIKAIENPYVDIIAHPTGRIINKRQGYPLNMSKVIEAAKKNSKILEINAHPSRLDLNDMYARDAIEERVKLSIGTDAHSADQLDFYKFGVYTARRAWATKKDIVNTFSLNKLKKLISR